jgi:hypothetical protein
VPKKPSTAGQALTDRIAHLGAASDAVRTGPENMPVVPPEVMPAEQRKPPTWDARISLTTSKEMKRAFDQARIEDGIEATARIRALMQLWIDDPRLRARANKLARTLR